MWTLEISVHLWGKNLYQINLDQYFFVHTNVLSCLTQGCLSSDGEVLQQGHFLSLLLTLNGETAQV